MQKSRKVTKSNDNTIRFTYFRPEVQISPRCYIFFKQAQKVIFSRKTEKLHNPPAIFNDIPAVRSSCQKVYILMKN